jgi:hypothetical protein
MIWKSKRPPQYIWIDDEWHREEDGKIFRANYIERCWYALDGEKVEWGKKEKIMDVGIRE